MFAGVWRLRFGATETWHDQPSDEQNEEYDNGDANASHASAAGR
jgi:hypothetical protein